jgi:hypothetical protein
MQLYHRVVFQPLFSSSEGKKPKLSGLCPGNGTKLLHPKVESQESLTLTQTGWARVASQPLFHETLESADIRPPG